MILGSALTWMRSFPVFPRSGAISVHGSYAPGFPVSMRFGRSRRGGPLATGIGQWATSSHATRLFPSRAEQFRLLIDRMFIFSHRDLSVDIRPNPHDTSNLYLTISARLLPTQIDSKCRTRPGVFLCCLSFSTLIIVRFHAIPVVVPAI